jgi:raffinose/stachyose/melibiose transport system permease protein
MTNQSRIPLPHITFGKVLSYFIFSLFTLITVLPLLWMFYSSFKTNEELNRNIYSLPHDMFHIKNDEYIVLAPSRTIIPDYDTAKDTRPRLILENTHIGYPRRIMVLFLVKSELPPEIASRQPGEMVYVHEFPSKIQHMIFWKTVCWNYTSAFIRGELTMKFLNSILYTLVSTFFSVLFGLMIGYAVSKLPCNRKLAAAVAAVIGLGYLIDINQVLIPLFLMLTKMKLTDTHIGIILVYTAFGLPMAVLLSSQFIHGLPSSLIESAYIDGASAFRTFISIITPMTKPVIITISIMNGLSVWNEFLLVLIFASSEATKSLPVGVFSFSSRTGVQMGWQLAALIIATLPVMIIYFCFQKRLAEGVSEGAIKE